MIVLAIQLALWEVISNLIAHLIPVTKIDLQTGLVLIAGFMVLALFSAWFQLKEK
jgi:hypothetical protein